MRTIKVRGIQAMAARRAGIGTKVEHAGKITQEVPVSRVEEVRKLAGEMARENGRRGAERKRLQASEAHQKAEAARDPLGMEGAEEFVEAAIMWRKDVQRAGAILALSVQKGFITHAEAVRMISGLP